MRQGCGSVGPHFHCPRVPQVFASFLIVAVVFLTFALAGYWRFGGMVGPNLLVDYSFVQKNDKPDTLIVIAWLGVAFDLVTSYPLVLNSARIAAFEIVSKEGVYGASKLTWALFTLLFIVATAIVGWKAEDISVIASIRGVTTTVSICVLFPGVMLWAGSGRYRRKPQNPHRIFILTVFLLALHFSLGM